ncbi:MAG TPA: hypothetical protein VF598_01790 [Hymenobacter sp.]
MTESADVTVEAVDITGLDDIDQQIAALAEQRKTKVVAAHEAAEDRVAELEAQADSPGYVDACIEVADVLDGQLSNVLPADNDEEIDTDLRPMIAEANRLVTAAADACRKVREQWSATNADAIERLQHAKAELAKLSERRQQVDPDYRPQPTKQPSGKVADLVIGWIKEAGGKLHTLTLGTKIKEAGLTRPGNLADQLKSRGVRLLGQRNETVYELANETAAV